jgi:hypothetical protein
MNSLTGRAVKSRGESLDELEVCSEEATDDVSAEDAIEETGEIDDTATEDEIKDDAEDDVLTSTLIAVPAPHPTKGNMSKGSKAEDSFFIIFLFIHYCEEQIVTDAIKKSTNNISYL